MPDAQAEEVRRAVAQFGRWVLSQPKVTSVYTKMDDGEPKMCVGHTGLDAATRTSIEEKVGVPVTFTETAVFRAL